LVGLVSCPSVFQEVVHGVQLALVKSDHHNDSKRRIKSVVVVEIIVDEWDDVALGAEDTLPSVDCETGRSSVKVMIDVSLELVAEDWQTLIPAHFSRSLALGAWFFVLQQKFNTKSRCRTSGTQLSTCAGSAVISGTDGALTVLLPSLRAVQARVARWRRRVVAFPVVGWYNIVIAEIVFLASGTLLTSVLVYVVAKAVRALFLGESVDSGTFPIFPTASVGVTTSDVLDSLTLPVWA